mgnify:CR=1 FL=1
MSKGYRELEAENNWLRGSLREARREKGQLSRYTYTLAALFSVSTILLVRPWAGVIVV